MRYLTKIFFQHKFKKKIESYKKKELYRVEKQIGELEQLYYQLIIII